MIVIPYAIMMLESEDDRNYMEWLYQKHQKLMLKTAWKYTSDVFEVEDIVSDSIVSLIKKVDRLRTMEYNSLRLYIVSTVRNTSINHFKKKKGLDEHFVSVGDEMVAAVISQDSIEQRISLNAELIATIRVIHSLPPKEQVVLRMKCFDKMSNDEIAQATGLAHESIRKYLSRAREKVRKAVYEKEESHR